ncbi:MAG: pyridoxal phosphate-dependent aminotransferase [Candidatus Neomarinimicrobiota bacterium]|nr:MAG: pyridoxal phosphate-dependent aminotransferase [bacterium]|tara:strand:- start:2017 stop:3213 length:1197 start_codon:yes stop_codon:yes gene_type:complete
MSALDFSDRVTRVKPSFTLEMTSRAADLRSKGVDVINLSVGEPDFNTPEHIIQAGKEAMDNGFTKYTSGPGMIELRKAICKKLLIENGLTFTPDQVLVSNGEKQSLYTACQALFDRGDEVIIFSPYWVSFPEFVRLADAEPIIVSTEANNQFEPNFNELISKINSKTKGMIINSPSNPTGGVWSNDAIAKILEISKKNDLIVISDECYEKLVFNGEYTSTEKLNTYNTEIVTCMSLSKTYAMTGWRIGYAVANHNIIRAMSKLQGQSTSCANSIGQKAAISALNGDQKCVEIMKTKYKERRDLMIQLLNEIEGVKCMIPGGAFYAFPDFSYYLGKNHNGEKINDSFELCDYILDVAKVVSVPGDGFGAPGHIRFSYAINKDTIRKGIDRIIKALSELN